MAAFICKVCGAALQLSAGDKICRCGACGVAQTVPLIDDEEKIELCASAERYRREYRYDKAIALYEELIRAYPTDADLYWSMLLCRYGVELTAGAEEQPTVSMNRTQARSLLADQDYRMALRYADREQRSVMEKFAAEIDRIRRRMVELSRGGERYDIYLCCRERDERGLSTPEHTAAKELYTRLTGDGFKVFCPDISLEEVQGSEWEPHIYSALNNARVMIVLGFSEESFSDVWVSNAYSRFATLAAEDRRKVMIPMLRGVTADKLPDVLKQYQAVDMTKLGYENDLVASLSSLLGVTVLKRPVAEPAPKDDPLLRRAYLHLEDSEFTEAAAAANRMLADDPENGEAHLILLMAEYTTASLDTLHTDFSVSENYRNAMRYGSEGLRFRLREYLNSALYGRYTELMQKGSYREAADGLRMLGDYRDSVSLAAQAESLASSAADMAEQLRLQQIYTACVAKLNSSNNIPELQNLQLTFAQLGDYRDCRELANRCASKIAKLTAQQRAMDTGYYSSSGRRANKAAGVIVIASVVVVIAAFMVLVGISNSSLGVEESAVTSPAQVVESQDDATRQYIKINGELMAIEGLINSGDASEALQRCLKLQEGGKLTAEQEERVSFLGGRAMLEMGNYEDAILVFESLDDYPGCDKWLSECSYRQAVELMQNGELYAAEEILMELDGYSDSAEKLNEVRYQQAEHYYDMGDHSMARTVFGILGDYSDARERHCFITCTMAIEKINEGRHAEALELLETACPCQNVMNVEPQCHAALFEQYIGEGDYERAEDSLWDLRDAVGFEWVRGDGYITLIEHYIENGPAYTAERLVGYLAEIDGYRDEAAHYACMTVRDNMDRADYSNVVRVLEPYEGIPEADEMLKEARAHINGESYIPSSVPDDVVEFGAQMVDNYSVGQVFVFGNFEQNGNTADGAEPIEWVVIHNEDGYLSAMSLRVLMVQPFGASETWEDSWLRSYLNMDFYFRAFSEKERSYLSTREFAAVYDDDPLNTDEIIIPPQYDYMTLPETLRIVDLTTAAREDNERFGDGTEYCLCVGYGGKPWVAENLAKAVSYEGLGEEYHCVRPVITFRKY